jgi:hypothetical protein
VFLREETLLGQRVFVVEEVPSQLAAQITTWKAPELGCIALKYQVVAKRPDGSVGVTTEAEPVGLALAEPSAALFQVPEGYEELKPSDFERRFLAKVGLPPDPDTASRNAQSDRDYLRLKTLAK